MAEKRGESLVAVTKVGDAVVLSPAGDVDLTASPSLRLELRRALGAKPPRLIVDLAGVPYMDSSGVATLVEALQLARRAGTRMVLSGLNERVLSIFEIARLDSLFVIRPDLDAALGA